MVGFLLELLGELPEDISRGHLKPTFGPEAVPEYNKSGISFESCALLGEHFYSS